MYRLLLYYMKNGKENIETLEKRHPEEWLLVEVTHADPLGNPKKGDSSIIVNLKKRSSKNQKEKSVTLHYFFQGRFQRKAMHSVSNY